MLAERKRQPCPAAPLTANTQDLAWAEQSATLALDAADRYVPTALEHSSKTREAERFEAFAAQLRGFHDLDQAGTER